MYVCAPPVCGTVEARRGALELLELELEMFVSHSGGAAN